MRKFLLLSQLFLFLLVSCSGKRVKVPDDLLPEEKMAEVLVDVELLEATNNSRMIGLEDRDERMKRYYREIFEHHGITEKEFNDSYSFYEKHPEKLEEIYTSVFEKLEKMQTEEETRIKSKKKNKPKKTSSSKSENQKDKKKKETKPAAGKQEKPKKIYKPGG